MQLNDLILISVDDHIIEPPGLFDRHIPSKYADRCPRMLLDAQTGAQTGAFEHGCSVTGELMWNHTVRKDSWSRGVAEASSHLDR